MEKTKAPCIMPIGVFKNKVIKEDGIGEQVDRKPLDSLKSWVSVGHLSPLRLEPERLLGT